MNAAIRKSGTLLLSVLRRLHRGEEAQGMVFGAISLFMLAACIGLVHNSGVVTSRRIQAQSAADSAAYAGSLMSADIISDVAWLNDGMAYVYYNLMRYAVDVTVYRTVAELREHNKWTMQDGQIVQRDDYLDPELYSAPYQQLASQLDADPLAGYLAAHDRAEEMIPRGEKWLEVLSELEEALAISGKYLVRDAVFKTAAANGNDVAAVAMVQTDPSGVTFMPDSRVSDIDMIIEYDPDGQPLWAITYNGQPYLQIFKHGPNHWEIVRPGIQSVDIYRHSDTDWTIRTGNLVSRITKYSDGTIEVDASGSQNSHLLCIPLDGGRWAVVGQAGGTSIKYEPFRDGGYKITVNGSSVGVRQQGGKMQQYTNGAWHDMPGQGTVTVGGKTIPVNFSNRVDLNPPHGNPSLDFPGTLNLGPISFTLPNRVRFAGTNITLLQDTVRIEAQVGNVALVIDGGKDNCVTLNGRSTCDPNSSNKRGYWIHGVFGHDRIETVTPGRKWIYKWRQINTVFTRDDLGRFGYHAIEDTALVTRIKNDWTGWFDTATGSTITPTAYYLTVPCWNPQDADDAYGPDGFIGPPSKEQYCPTCNPYHDAIDFDQRFETAADGDYILDKDGDMQSDVRKYGLNTVFFQQHVSRNENDRDYQQVHVGANARPLCLTESIFAHPLVVAVWIRPDKPFLGSQFAPPINVSRDENGNLQARRQGGSRWAPLFRNPDWGYFSVACSRVGVLDAEDDDYKFTFDADADNYTDFRFDTVEFNRRLDDRADWLTSWHNLYEPVWTARLWSMSEAVRSVDMEIANRQAELNEWDDVSKNFVWRMLQDYAPWMDPNSESAIDPIYFGGEVRGAFGRIRGPRTGTFGVSTQTPPEQLEEALKH